MNKEHTATLVTVLIAATVGITVLAAPAAASGVQSPDTTTLNAPDFVNSGSFQTSSATATVTIDINDQNVVEGDKLVISLNGNALDDAGDFKLGNGSTQITNENGNINDAKITTDNSSNPSATVTFQGLSQNDLSTAGDSITLDLDVIGQTQVATKFDQYPAANDFATIDTAASDVSVSGDETVISDMTISEVATYTNDADSISGGDTVTKSFALGFASDATANHSDQVNVDIKNDNLNEIEAINFTSGSTVDSADTNNNIAGAEVNRETVPGTDASTGKRLNVTLKTSGASDNVDVSSALVTVDAEIEFRNATRNDVGSYNNLLLHRVNGTTTADYRSTEANLSTGDIKTTDTGRITLNAGDVTSFDLDATNGAPIETGYSSGSLDFDLTNATDQFSNDVTNSRDVKFFLNGTQTSAQKIGTTTVSGIEGASGKTVTVIDGAQNGVVDAIIGNSTLEAKIINEGNSPATSAAPSESVTIYPDSVSVRTLNDNVVDQSKSSPAETNLIVETGAVDASAIDRVGVKLELTSIPSGVDGELIDPDSDDGVASSATGSVVANGQENANTLAKQNPTYTVNRIQNGDGVLTANTNNGSIDFTGVEGITPESYTIEATVNPDGTDTANPDSSATTASTTLDVTGDLTQVDSVAINNTNTAAGSMNYLGTQNDSVGGNAKLEVTGFKDANGNEIKNTGNTYAFEIGGDQVASGIAIGSDSGTFDPTSIDGDTVTIGNDATITIDASDAGEFDPKTNGPKLVHEAGTLNSGYQTVSIQQAGALHYQESDINDFTWYNNTMGSYDDISNLSTAFSNGQATTDLDMMHYGLYVDAANDNARLAYEFSSSSDISQVNTGTRELKEGWNLVGTNYDVTDTGESKTYDQDLESVDVIGPFDANANEFVKSASFSEVDASTNVQSDTAYWVYRDTNSSFDGTRTVTADSYDVANAP